MIWCCVILQDEGIITIILHQILYAKRKCNMKIFLPKTTKSLFLIAVGLSISTISEAHDFWLAPESYALEGPGHVDVSVLIGHPKERLNWPLQPHRIIGLRSIGPNGVSDHQAALADYQPSEALPIKLDSDGLHIMTIETTNAISVLKASKFNAYIEEEGITPIKIDRVMQGTTNEAGRETYSRRGKTLIQVGEISEADPEYLLRPIGLTLEIVPLQNPARLKQGEIFSSQVFYRGVPVSGATIGLINLQSKDENVILSKTDAGGFVKFERPPEGEWMLHVVWSDKLENNDKAEYDTIFSSLSFKVFES